MLDLQTLRKNAELVQTGLTARGASFDWEAYHRLEAERKQLQSRTERLQAERNQGAKSIGSAKAAGDDRQVQELLAAMESSKAGLAQAQQRLSALQAELEALLLTLPNLPDASVPLGADESANALVRSHGAIPQFSFAVRAHEELFPERKFLDFDYSSSLAGSRFVSLKGPVARLHRALAQFMLDVHTQRHGYCEHYLPYLVRPEILQGTGQLPKFAEDLFATTDGRYLIPTAEVPLTNVARERIFAPEELPIKLVAHTPCFRQEAGSYGRDTKGMLRQHQFDKVELVQIVKPEDSYAALEEMCAQAEYILQQLGLSYRVMALCSGDLGFASAKTYDLEVWLPAQSCYREISSLSNCTDFQARRMQGRWRPQPGSSPELVHSLNGSGLAVGRALIAVLENYQQADGSVLIPEVLRSYMGGSERIID